VDDEKETIILLQEITLKKLRDGKVVLLEVLQVFQDKVIQRIPKN